MAGSSPQGGAGTGPSGGNGGMAGTGGGVGGAPIDGCDGFDISQSGALDLDLRAVTVTGRVTLAGALLPDEMASRGSIVFRSTDGRSTASVALEATGARTYAVRLPPGSYDVSYAANAELCAGPNLPNVPCGSGQLVTGAALVADGVLDIDIPVVAVTGVVTLEGLGFPETAQRGSIAFRGVRSDAGGSVALPATGAASYGVTLLPGAYDVWFVGDPSECTGETPPAVPCNSGVLRPAIALESTGVLDLDVPAVRVSGVVTLNGSLPPTETAQRGQLAFVGEAGEALSTMPFAASGATSYEVVLLPGDYAVDYVPSEALCAASEATSMPCVGGTVVSERDLTSDGVLDVDVPAVTVTGQVTVNGAPLADEGGARGALSFANRVGGFSTVGVADSGPGRYSLRVLPGSYDVDFVPNPALCGAELPPGVPCTGGPVGRGVSIQADGVYDVDLKRVRVTGGVSLNGSPMPETAGGRGTLVFASGASAVTHALGATGAATYDLSLWPGTYRVAFDGSEASCDPTAPATPVPSVGGTLVAAVPLEMDGVLDLDVRSVTVSGNLTLNGAPLSAADARGSLDILRALDAGADACSRPLDGTYSATLTPGRYVFLHTADPQGCTGTEPAPAVPCASQALIGCGTRAQ